MSPYKILTGGDGRTTGLHSCTIRKNKKISFLLDFDMAFTPTYRHPYLRSNDFWCSQRASKLECPSCSMFIIIIILRLWLPWISLLIQIIQCQKLTKKVKHNRASENVIYDSRHSITTFIISKVAALNWGTFCDMSKSVALYWFIKQRPQQTASNKAALLLLLLLLLVLAHLGFKVSLLLFPLPSSCTCTAYYALQ